MKHCQLPLTVTIFALCKFAVKSLVFYTIFGCHCVVKMGIKRQIYLLIAFAVLYCVEGQEIDTKVVAARIESCKGCRLNRLPDVKKFIFEDVPLLSNEVVFKPIQGASPELIFLNNLDQEVDRIDLAPLTRDDCNKLLTEKGFSKQNPDSPSIQHSDF